MLKTWYPSWDEIIESLAGKNINMGQSTQLRLVEQVHRYLFSLVVLWISTSPKSGAVAGFSFGGAKGPKVPPPKIEN